MTRPNVNVTVGGPKKPTNYTYKTVVLKSNLPFDAQITEPNCIYIIKWDFNLNGENIIIPENCVLKFEGGSLSNGTIVGNNTSIDAVPVKIFSTDISLEGTWNVTEAYPEWFGAKGDGVTDDTVAFQKTFDSFTTVVFRETSYLIKSDTFNAKITDATDVSKAAVKITKPVTIVGNNATIKTYRDLKTEEYSINYYAFEVNAKVNVSNLTIDGSTIQSGSYGFELNIGDHSVFKDCRFIHLGSSGIVFNGTEETKINYCTVENCYFNDCGNSIYCAWTNYSTFKNIKFITVSEGFDFDKLCSYITISDIKAEGIRGEGADSIIEINGGHDFSIDNVICHNVKRGIQLLCKLATANLSVNTDLYNVVINNITIDGCRYYPISCGAPIYDEQENMYVVHDVTLSNLVLRNSRSDAINVTGYNISIENLITENNYYHGIRADRFVENINIKGWQSKDKQGAIYVLNATGQLSLIDVIDDESLNTGTRVDIYAADNSSNSYLKVKDYIVKNATQYTPTSKQRLYNFSNWARSEFSYFVVLSDTFTVNFAGTMPYNMMLSNCRINIDGLMNVVSGNLIVSTNKITDIGSSMYVQKGDIIINPDATPDDPAIYICKVPSNDSVAARRFIALKGTLIDGSGNPV